MGVPKYLTVGAGLDAVIYGDDADGLPVYRRLAGDESIILAADHDRIVAEAEARGWNSAVEAAIREAESERVDWSAEREIDVRIALRLLVTRLAALRKPEVEG